VSAIYLAAGVAAQDGLIMQTPAGTFTTGLVDANFTKKLSKGTTGNQSVSGITVTEVDATNNAGVYTVAIPAATVPAANGAYTLLVYLTADPTFSFQQIYYVTTNGLPGTIGTLSFTATAANGRVVDGAGAAVAGATVIFTKTGYLSSVVTDASGLWTQYFDASFGAVTLTVVKSGYAQSTSSLTVGASSVTGPGADISISTVVNSGNIIAADLWAYARRQAFNKTGTQADTKIKQAVQDSLDRFAKSYSWNWYWRRGWLNINGAYSTGTITLTKGSANAVLAGGTWPTWAASGRIFYGNQILDIASRTSGTTVVLSGTWNGATVAGATYKIFQEEYSLPVDHFEFGRFFEGQAWPYAPTPIPIQEIWTRMNAFNIGSQFAWAFGIHNGKIALAPYPSTDMSCSYTYRVRPATLVNDSDIVDLDPGAIECLRHLINYYIALYFGETVAGAAQACLDLYTESLERQIANDKQATQGAQAGSKRANVPMWLSKTTPVNW
jgi:hypothetical protein